MSRALALVEPSDALRKFGAPEPSPFARPLLETKLYVPRPPAGIVARKRLTAVMQRRDEEKLTLVTAPAGFGKTTVLATWLADSAASAHVAWVSLDSSDSEPQVFWAYVARALEKTHAAFGPAVGRALQSDHSPDFEHVVAMLINEVASIDADFVLVLDDYHVITDAQTHASLTLLLDRLPPRMRVVIASRAEPPLALPRRRARGELLELRADELRFTTEEASAFLNDVMALGLSTADLGTLERRTEGWIAGLKLAAHSLKGRGDPRQFVDAFSGENRHVADYLVEEVLGVEPEHVRDFLLATSILDRLNGPLCDAVTGRAGSQALLEELERRNLFVVPLDDRREWYRYHHLFADVLQKRSAVRNGDAVRAFHGRASAWYEMQGAIGDAIGHALAGADMERAAGLLERNWPEKDRSHASAKWLSVAKALPDGVVRNRPVLAMGFAWALLNNGELEAAESWFNEVERVMAADAASLVIGDARRFETLPKELTAARVYLAQSRGEVPGTLEHAQRVLENASPDDPAGLATATALVALAHWGRGELEPAYQTFSRALDLMRAADHDLDYIRGIFVLGDIRASQGRLVEARSIYERGLAMTAESPKFATAETDELHLGLSELHREWNDLASAVKHLDLMKQQRTATAHRGNQQRWCIAMACVLRARGDVDGALEFLDEADKHERRDPVPKLRPIPALRARMRIARGDLELARVRARDAKVSVSDEPSYLREFEHLTLARLMIAQGGDAVRDAVQFLDRLRIAALTGGRAGSNIEILMLQALAQQAAGNQRAALESLTGALTFAEPQGYLRVFLDEGERMRELLRTATARGLGGVYTRRVLAAFEAPVPPVVPPPVAAPLVEPGQALTTRELEILRLIAAGMRNQQIADHLSISAATVKRHIANAYAKLGASHRTEALIRAGELGIL